VFTVKQCYFVISLLFLPEAKGICVNRVIQAYFENSIFPMLIIEEGKFVYSNMAAVKLLGYQKKSELANVQPFKLSPKLQPCGTPSIEKAPEMMRLALENGSHQFEWEYLKKDGTEILLEVSLATAVINNTTQLHVILRDLSRRQRRDRELRESEERFRQTFEANPDPVILADTEDGIIIDVNQAFEKATGISRLEAIGHNSEQLGIWEKKDMRHTFLDKLKHDGEVNNFEAEFRIPGEKTKTGLLSARIIIIESAPFFLIVIRDITKEKEAERMLIEMSNMKSEFISTAAHELRTPITGIMGYTELLSDRELAANFDETQKQDFRLEISNNCTRLAKIVDDILDVSRIETGQKLPLEIDYIAIKPMLKKAAQHFEIKTKRQIDIEIKPDAPTIISADEHRLRQVMDNLLSNAIKYSAPESEIRLTVAKQYNHCMFCVSDKGIGMSEDQVKHIFDKFYRADRSDTSVSGLGLGMSIVKQIIEEHGGEIHVKSIISHGTDICFTIPIEGGIKD
jgi:PAS domain S-box-containing protein